MYRHMREREKKRRWGERETERNRGGGERGRETEKGEGGERHRKGERREREKILCVCARACVSTANTTGRYHSSSTFWGGAKFPTRP